MEVWKHGNREERERASPTPSRRPYLHTSILPYFHTSILPCLLVLYYLLFTLSCNIHQAVWDGPAFAVVAALSLGFAAALYAVLRRLFGSPAKAALAACFALFLIYSYGFLADTLALKTWAGIPVGRQRMLLPAWCAFLAGGLFLIGKVRGGLERPLVIVGAMVAFLLLRPAAGIVSFEARRLGQRPPRVVALPAAHAANLPDARARPDIYYLIFDRYASASSLKEFYGFDNRPFLDALRARGFYVAERSHANYGDTQHSLASSLNLIHLDDLAAAMGRGSNDYTPLHRMLRDHQVARFLRARGYRSVHLGGWWDPTRHNPYADESIDWYGRATSEFARMFVAGTVFFRAGLGFGVIDQRREHWNCVRFQFEQLERQADEPGPKLVFAHFLLTHDPYAFDRAGGFLPLDRMKALGDPECYRESVRFANHRILALLDRLQAPGRPAPVILLQADEGPYPPASAAPGFTWDRADPATLRWKMGILNAYSLPGSPEPALHPAITPVNSFRVVLNRCFDAGLPLLPDRVHVFRDARHGYDLTDVTGKLGE